MPEQVLIIKTGAPPSPIAAQHGDFEDWITTGLGLDRGSVDLAEVSQGAPLPDPDSFGGIVLTGSPAMVSHHEAWSERTAAWLPQAVSSGVPTLGICYGHQLLAYALGGHVGPNPHGRTLGTYPIHLERAAHSDPLLAVLPDPADVHFCHREVVLSLPSGAQPLASQSTDPRCAFVYGDAAWGVQFHPEFNAAITRSYLEARRDLLHAEGLDPEALAGAIIDTPFGETLLKRFATIVDATNPTRA